MDKRNNERINKKGNEKKNVLAYKEQLHLHLCTLLLPSLPFPSLSFSSFHFLSFPVLTLPFPSLPFPSLILPYLFISVLQAFDESELLECIRRLVEIEQDWVPDSSIADLYVRPTFISIEVQSTETSCSRPIVYFKCKT